MKVFVGFALFIYGSEALSGLQLQRMEKRNFHHFQQPSMDLALRMSADDEEGSRRRKRDALIGLWNRVKPKKKNNNGLNQEGGELSAADSLRLQAERMRLEAARMDAELTLSKIAKLEEALTLAKAKGKPVEDMQSQLESLQVKLQGIDTTGKKAEPVVDVQGKETPEEAVVDAPVLTNDTPKEEKVVSVDFMEKVISDTLQSDSSLSINSSELADKLSSIKSGEMRSSNPSYSQDDISEKVRKIENEIENDPSQKQILDLVDGNLTQLALFSLELDEYIQSGTYNELNLTLTSSEPQLKELFSLDSIEKSSLDRSIETLYPKCMRREELAEPSMMQVQSLISVLPNAKFTRTSNPEKVLGGYVIRGRHTWESGEDLISAIDAQLEKENLSDKMTVLYAPDFTVFSNFEENDGEIDLYAGEQPDPILYVTAPEYCPDRNRIALSLTSALALATSWYLSLYPFLLNPKIASRVEEQLSLADASMGYDLDWLTELSIPLFVAFVGIQFMHEAAHSLVAAKYEMKTTVPTFVPSLITGTTSSVTTFKEPPKSKEALFDFAVAGPLAGMVSSIIAIAIGSQLTVGSDLSTLPSLPVEILRQSLLGGGIIENFLTGSLNVPSGAPATGILVSLHPIAVAGYISLVVNALNVLPIGTTDGGRIAMTAFGRPAKLVVGNLFMASLLFTGLLGSDLFLFYFAFLIAFQTGNEIACRDETAEIASWRVGVAVATYSLAFLCLIPIQ